MPKKKKEPYYTGKGVISPALQEAMPEAFEELKKRDQKEAEHHAALASALKDDETFKVVDVHFWGSHGGKATMIVKSKLDLEHIENSALECKETKNPKPGAMLPVYQYGTITQEHIDALPRERVPEDIKSLIANNKKRNKRRPVADEGREGEDDVVE